MRIFKKSAKNETVATSAPEEPETPGEIKHIEELSGSDEKKKQSAKVEQEAPTETYREIPVCLSQAQVNNLIIENNAILKQILSENV